MKQNSSTFHWHRSFQAFSMLCLCLLSGCATTSVDPEYASKLTQVRTDWSGKEIVGVWITSAVWDYLGIQTPLYNCVLLLKPDGTGRLRNISDKTGAGAGETQLEWRYEGSGIWRAKQLGVATAKPGETPTHYPDPGSGFTSARIQLRYTGDALLWDSFWDMGGGFFSSQQWVFVRSDNEAGVQRKLQSWQQ